MKCTYQYGEGLVLSKKYSWYAIQNLKTGRISYHLEKYVRVRL